MFENLFSNQNNQDQTNQRSKFQSPSRKQFSTTKFDNLFANRPKPKPQPQPPQNFIQKAESTVGNAASSVFNFGKQAVKQVTDFLPQAPEYAKEAATNIPESSAGLFEGSLKTASSFGRSALRFDGFVLGGLQSGYSKLFNVPIPDIFNISQQSQALNKTTDAISSSFFNQKNKEMYDSFGNNIAKQHAYQVGQFAAGFIPYVVGSGVAEAGLVKASEFLPALTKFIPAISDAVGFVGVDQIIFDPNDGSTRLDVLKNDLINLALFKTGTKISGLLTKGLSDSISKGITKMKDTQPVNVTDAETFVKRANEAIKNQTGSTPENIIKQDVQSSDPLLATSPSTSSFIDPKVYADSVGGQPSGIKNISDLKTSSFDQGNIDTTQVQAVKSSIQAGDKINPIVIDQNGNVLDGNNRLQALKELGVNNVETVTVPSKPIATPQGEVPLKVSKIAKEIEAKAVEDKLTPGFSQLAGYDPITIKDQAARATDLVNNHYEDALDMIKGNKPLPEGLRGISLVTAMEQSLKDNPDPNLALELARSPLVSETSGAAQTLRLAAERDPYTPTNLIKQLEDARKAVFGKDTSVSSVVSDIKKSVQKALPDKTAWQNFIDEITC